MPMNVVIREKRKELGMTQEQVAAYLGVTTPAVNRWEKGVTFPEVTLLPGLARLLKIDLNTLFCFLEEPSDQEIGHDLNEVAELMEKEGFEKGYAFAMEKIREFPNCHKLIHGMTMMVEGSLLMLGLGEKEREIYEEDLVRLYERTLQSEDSRISESSAVMLFSKYLNRKDYKQAEEMLERISEERGVDKNLLKAQLFLRQDKNEEAAALLERKLYQEATDIFAVLVSLAEIARKERKEEEAVLIGRIAEQHAALFQLSRYVGIPIRLENAAAKQKTEECLGILRELLSCAEEEWKPKNSVLYRHMAEKWKMNSVRMDYLLKPLLTVLKEEKAYDFLRENQEFQELLKEWEIRLEES